MQLNGLRLLTLTAVVQICDVCEDVDVSAQDACVWCGWCRGWLVQGYLWYLCRWQTRRSRGEIDVNSIGRSQACGQALSASYQRVVQEEQSQHLDSQAPLASPLCFTPAAIQRCWQMAEEVACVMWFTELRGPPPWISYPICSLICPSLPPSCLAGLAGMQWDSISSQPWWRTKCTLSLVSLLSHCCCEKISTQAFRTRRRTPTGPCSTVSWVIAEGVRIIKSSNRDIRRMTHSRIFGDEGGRFCRILWYSTSFSSICRSRFCGWFKDSAIIVPLHFNSDILCKFVTVFFQNLICSSMFMFLDFCNTCFIFYLISPHSQLHRSLAINLIPVIFMALSPWKFSVTTTAF